MGRAPVITLPMQELICGLISMGISKYRAARHVGVSRSTMYRTIKQDPEFARQVREAGLKQELSPLQQIRLHMPKDWRAAAWVAERQSTDWAKLAPDTVTIADMTGIFSAMMKLLLEGVRSSDDRKQINKNFDKLFQRICGKKRFSPRVRQAIKKLKQDREKQQLAGSRRPEACADEPSAERPQPIDPRETTSPPEPNASERGETQRDEP